MMQLGEKKKVFLHGDLAKFGTEYSFCTNYMGDIISGLEQLDGFKSYARKNPKFYFVKGSAGNTEALEESNVNDRLEGWDEIHIVPEVNAAGVETAAAVLAALAIEATATAIAITMIVMNVGAMLLMSALSQALSPSPGGDGKTQTAQNDSYIFSGAVTATEIGSAKPYIYGTDIECAGALIGASLTNEDIPYVPPTPTSGGIGTTDAIPVDPSNGGDGASADGSGDGAGEGSGAGPGASAGDAGAGDGGTGGGDGSGTGGDGGTA